MLNVNKDNYWIASYSVHSEILEKIVGEDGEVQRLCVDCGGLRSPRHATQSETLLRNYTSPKKTLHAKVLLKKKRECPTELWLWTGNIRKATFEAQNVLLSFPLLERKAKTIENELFSWFENPETSIVFKSDGMSITELNLQKNDTLWEDLKESMKSVKDSYGYDKRFKFYAISPWGGSRIVNEIIKCGFSSISLYSRYETDRRDLWIDQVLVREEYFATPSSERWVANERAAFPHMKCMFMTEVSGKRETLVWSYIGSANFTKKALFNKGNDSNVEHAVLFEGESANKRLHSLFNCLTKDLCGTYWKSRKTDFGPSKTIDDSEDEKKSETDLEDPFENFERRDFCRIIEPKLLKKSNQKKLDTHYDDPNWFTLVECRIRVLSIELGCYHLLAKKSGRSAEYEIDVPRTLDVPLPLTQREVAGIIEDISSFDGSVEKLKNKKGKSGIRKPSKEKFESDDDIAFFQKTQNVRFIARKFFDSQGNVKADEVRKAYLMFKRIEPVKDRFNVENAKFYAIWYPLVEKMMERIK